MNNEPGDKVRIIANTNDHKYTIGRIITIKYIVDNNEFYAMEIENDSIYFVAFVDCEPIHYKDFNDKLNNLIK